MSHWREIMSPWWFTDKIIRKYLECGVPYMTGRMLDSGCGRQPYRNMFSCEEYVGMEMTANFKPDIVGDVRHMDMVGDSSFDSILSNQVLEHVDDVQKAMDEMYRVLKPGGYLCLTAPFIGRLHGMPHDYWRFSTSGLRYLFEKHHFDVVLIEPMGGFITTQCYLWQFFIYEKCSKFEVTRYLCQALMVFLNPLSLLLHQFDRDTTTPFNYLVIGKRQ